jgi:replication-associated recombination protein RarA
MSPVQFYQPTDRGLERAIKEKLERLRELNEQAGQGGAS